MRRRHLCLIAGLAISVLAAGPAAADKDAGCGLGTVLWEGRTGTVWKLMASTTNQWLGTQVIGITLGTSGCGQGGTVTAELQLQMFVASNVDKIARDMALGEGEALEALASLLEIAPADRDAFYRLTQSNFGAIFPSEQVNAGEVVASLQQMMAADPLLASYVGG